MEFAIDTLNENCYDCNMGKQLALIADGKSKKDDEKVFNRYLIDYFYILLYNETIYICYNFINIITIIPQ